MTTEEMKQSSYQCIKDELEKAFASGAMPNVKGFKKVIASLKKRMKLVESGTSFFARSQEDVTRAELAVARLSGQLQAYQEKLNMITEKLKQNE